MRPHHVVVYSIFTKNLDNSELYDIIFHWKINKFMKDITRVLIAGYVRGTLSKVS